MKECVQSNFTSGSVRAFFVKLCLYGGSVYGIWDDSSVRNKLMFDFLAAESRDESWDIDDAFMLTVMGIAIALVSNSFDIETKWVFLGLPSLPTIDDTLYLLSVCPEYSSMIRNYAGVMEFDLVCETHCRDYLGEVRSHFARIPIPSNTQYTDVLRLIDANAVQHFVFSAILQALLSPQPHNNCFHINGPAGSGKTFVSNGLLFHERLHSHVLRVQLLVSHQSTTITVSQDIR